MEKSPFKRFSKGEFRGVLREDLIGLLLSDFFEDPVSSVRRMNGQVLKESRFRWAAIFSLPEEKRVFVKKDKTKDWADALKFLLLSSKARKEWSVACRLRKKSLPVPVPLGWMERRRRGFVEESYYLSEAVGSGVSLIDLLDSNKEVFAESLAKRVKAFHDAGLFHKDLHGGNFLWDEDSFFLTDLHRAEILRSLSRNQRLRGLSQLFHSLKSQWGQDDFLRFMEVYFAGDPDYSERKEDYTQKVLGSMEHLQRRWWRSRTKRCTRESSEFSVEREEGMTIYHRRSFGVEQIKKVIGEHQEVMERKPSDLLKHAPESVVSVLNARDERICVKQFRHPRWVDRLKENFRRSKGLKAWIAGNGLTVRGIPSLRVMACAERKNGPVLKESFLLMEASEPGQEMDRYLLRGFEDFRRKRLFIRAFAQWLSLLHQKNVFHRDMKACNIVVSRGQEDWLFHLLDLEDLRLDRRVEAKELFKNLLQLNTSIPRSMTHRDRLRFFKEYLRHHPIVKEEKPFLSRLVEKSRERGVVYVSPQGVIEEKWG